MIPTLILIGLLLGHWWKTTPIVAALMWPAVLWADHTIGPSGLAPAALLAFLNTATGVGIHQLIRAALRALHPHRDKHA